MKDILRSIDMLEDYTAAGTGSFLACDGAKLASISPIDNRAVGTVRVATLKVYETVISRSIEAFRFWRDVPAPKRGDIVRQMADTLRKHKKELGALISLEVGKIRSEGEGEIQEMIDIADFAVGQSRMLYGLTMHSERPGHRMYEQWHPLGPVGVVTAFNFPSAVWAWNAFIALAAGDTVVWKPSSKAFITALAIMKLAWRVLKQNGLPEGILSIIIGDRKEIGDALIQDRRVPLISATGSIPMGRHIAQSVSARLGKTLLELGGNNAIIITPSADIDLALRAIVFGAVGTAGQRCTSTRRLIIHKDIYPVLTDALIKAYRQIPIGSPLDKATLMGPLIDRQAVSNMQTALRAVKDQGGQVLYGGEVLSGGIYDAGTYVTPCLCAVDPDCPMTYEETFAPILYLIQYQSLDEAITYHNAVPQGLSSAIFSNDLRETEAFLSAAGSDCGIANVNVGTSGAEIGGAFGGEKDTGGGREAGSDAWKAYMRRQTNTINWSGEIPLAQGIKFELRESS